MSKRIPMDPSHPDMRVLSELGAEIRKGAVIAFPTDTYYGLAANPFDADAVARLFKIKGRPDSKPILLLIDQKDRLKHLVLKVSPLADAVMSGFWPGPLTLVFEAASNLSDVLTAGSGTIGIRLPKACLPLELIRAAGVALTATSANPSGGAAPTTAAAVMASIGSKLDAVIDGGKCQSSPSTLLDVRGEHPKVLREGQVSIEQLRAFFRSQDIEFP